MKFILFADVYGFSAMVNSNLDETNDKLKKLHTRFERIINIKIKSACDNYSIQYYLLSDNVFLVYDTGESKNQTQSTQCWEAFYDTCLKLYEASIDFDLPLRGGIGAGDLISEGTRLLGAPIIEAAEFEKNISLPFIFIPESIISYLHENKVFSTKYFEKYENKSVDIPYQQGLIACYPILPLNGEKIENYAKSKYHKYRGAIKTSKPAKAWKDAMFFIQKWTGNT